MTRILLLGRDGQVGWQLQRSLAPHGAVTAWGRPDCDLADLDRLRRMVRELAPEVIVNAAAYTAVDKAETDREAAFRLNAGVPGLLAEESARLGGLLVHYSTDYVFDGEKDAPYLEDDPVNPLSVYGLSKRAGEEAVLAAGGRSLIFRTSWVFGVRGSNFAKTILRLARERESLNVVDDQVGNPTPAALVSTVTGLALALLRRQGGLAMGEGRIYNLAGAGAVSWCRFARTVVELASRRPDHDLTLVPEAIRPIPASDYPTPARRPRNSRLDCRRLEADFGLVMPPWQPYLERMMEILAHRRSRG